jgi:hypothetical protein
MRHTVNNYNIRLPIAHWSPYDPLGRLDGQAIPLLSLLSPMGFPKSQVSGTFAHKRPGPIKTRAVGSPPSIAGPFGSHRRPGARCGFPLSGACPASQQSSPWA